MIHLNPLSILYFLIKEGVEERSAFPQVFFPDSISSLCHHFPSILCLHASLFHSIPISLTFLSPLILYVSVSCFLLLCPTVIHLFCLFVSVPSLSLPLPLCLCLPLSFSQGQRAPTEQQRMIREDVNPGESSRGGDMGSGKDRVIW